MDKYDEAIIAFCVAALVAYSIEAFARRAAFVGPLIFAAAAVLGVLTAVLADRALIPGQVAERLAYFDGSLYLALAFIAGLLATSLFRGHTRRSGVGAVFVLASLVIASSFTSYFVPLYYLVDRSAALSESALLGAPYIAALKNVLADGRRVFSPDHVLFPDWSAAFGIEDVRALDALYDYRYTPFLTAFRNGRAFPDMIFTGAPDTDFAAAAVKQWLALSAVGAIVTETKLPTGDYTLAYSDSSVKIYRVRKSLPMISAFSSVSYVASGAQALAAISNPHFDPLTTLVVEADPRTMPRFATPASIAPGTIRRLTSSTILAEIDARYPSMLLNDATNYPGWHAFVDGKATPILSADYLFQAIVVPAGKHVVEFRYEPASVAVGGVVSVVSLIAMLGVAIIAGVRRYA
jgi:hypothetical protein